MSNRFRIRSNATEALACLNEPAAQPLGGLLCTLKIVPHVALHQWRWGREWAVVGGLFCVLWLQLCVVTCYCVRKCAERDAKRAAGKRSGTAPAAAGSASSAAPEDVELHDQTSTGVLERKQSSAVEINFNTVARMRAAAGPMQVSQPPPAPPAPPPLSQPSAPMWYEYLDDSSQMTYYEEDETGQVSWDPPPDGTTIIREDGSTYVKGDQAAARPSNFA